MNEQELFNKALELIEKLMGEIAQIRRTMACPTYGHGIEDADD